MDTAESRASLSGSGAGAGRAFHQLHAPRRARRVPRPGGCGGFLGWRDLAVGGRLALYGREFRLLGCDGATRRWLEEQGAAPGPEEAWPEGPYDVVRKQQVGWEAPGGSEGPPAAGADLVSTALREPPGCCAQTHGRLR
jgi:hypothetical protein